MKKRNMNEDSTEKLKNQSKEVLEISPTGYGYESNIVYDNEKNSEDQTDLK